MSGNLQDTIGRILWRDGQVLASRDLRAALQEDARRRRLHNRYLHASWGIAFGFSPALDQYRAHVTISPGYAIDSEGRDLLLAENYNAGAPSADGMFILVAAFGEADSCCPSPPETDFCSGPDPRRLRAAFHWMDASDVDFGIHVPLARATFAGGQVQGDLDLRVRRYARRLARPHIGQGVTKAGSTGWKDVSLPKRPAVWLQVHVDTSETGFINTPRYLAALLRQNPPRKKPRTGSLDEIAAPLGTAPALSLDGIGGIVKPTPIGFTYRIPRQSLPFGADLTASEAEAGGWVVSWIGIEQPVAGQQLQLDLAVIAAALGVIL